MNSSSPNQRSSKPWVLIPACHRQDGLNQVASINLPYLEAVQLSGCRPLVVPLGNETDISDVLDLVDGLLLSGSPSNLDPSFYQQTLTAPGLPKDPMRDAFTLPLIRAAIDRGTPLFAICRGFQEFNVAFGGSLHQAVHKLPGKLDHRPTDEDNLDQKFGPAHQIDLVPGGLLHDLLGKDTVMVNSIHGQAIDRLAEGLTAEAHAPDGTIEAITHREAKGFNFGAQWHPEWQAAKNPISMALLEKFGQACLDHQRAKKLPR